MVKTFYVKVQNILFSHKKKTQFSTISYSSYNFCPSKQIKRKKGAFSHFSIFSNKENLEGKRTLEDEQQIGKDDVYGRNQSSETNYAQGDENVNEKDKTFSNCCTKDGKKYFKQNESSTNDSDNVVKREMKEEVAHKIAVTPPKGSNSCNARRRNVKRDENVNGNSTIDWMDPLNGIHEDEALYKGKDREFAQDGKGEKKENIGLNHVDVTKVANDEVVQVGGDDKVGHIQDPASSSTEEYFTDDDGVYVEKKKKTMDIRILRTLPLVSIIGRPNVGKSTIFNRLTRKFQDGSIVLDRSSTRDTFYGEVEWNGYKFEVVDTGGLIFEDEKFSKEIRDQILLSLQESSVVLLVVDGINGVHPVDMEICRFLRKYIKKEYYKTTVYSMKDSRESSHKISEGDGAARGDMDIQLQREDKMEKHKREEEKQKGTMDNNPLDSTVRREPYVEMADCSHSSTSCDDIKNKSRYICNERDEANEWGEKERILRIIVCVNKCESYKDGFVKAQNFWELGFGTPFPCSGIHGNGLSEILDECIKYIKKVEIDEMEEEKNESNTINISFIGKPNTGKSSILNKILNCNRFIVSPIAGTTIDSIDVLVKIKDNERIYRLIDTAGIQKRKKNVPFNEKTKYEYLLYNRTEKAIKRSDVCVLVIDSYNGISSHDINIARKILQENKSCIICCNKWDLIYNKNDIFNDTKNYVLNLLRPIDFADILFISAKTSQRLLNIFERAEETYKNYTRRVNTNTLNEIIKEALLLRPPIPIKNKTLNIYYAFQAHIKPPGFVFFCNSEKSAYLNYTKYLEGRIRETFNIRGTPVKIYYKQKKKRRLIKKTKNPDKYNLDIETIQKNFQKMQLDKKHQGR
ncbi:GTP-binding protein, putative [Plasmodium ovale]|nr:GTP-binding protein, putative [Plasmodium ovale]